MKHNLCGCWLNTYWKILVKVLALHDIEGRMGNWCWMSPTQDLKGHYMLFTSLNISFQFISFTIIPSNIPTTYLQDTHPNIRRAIDDVSVDVAVALSWPCQVEECHKMMCRSCGTKFCFGCGAILTENYTCCPAQICKNIARTRGWVGRLVDFGGLMGQSDKSDVSLVFLLFRILTCFDSWHDVSVLVRSCAHPPVHF